MENAAMVADHEDFITALALLHSTDVDSAEKLRRMLDASIARRCGHKKSLAARMARFDPSTDLTQSLESNGEEPATLYKYEIDGTDTITSQEPFTQAMSNQFETIFYQNIRNLVIDVDSKTDIPTISIPDDPGSSSAGDGALCKVCNGGRLGPLILLECQECQDVYHPLCHQPPVLDLDIYDPRLVWHCAKCVELSEAAAIVGVADAVDAVTAKIDDSKFQSKGKTMIDYNNPKMFQHQPNFFNGNTKTSLNFEHANGTMERVRHSDSTSLRKGQPTLAFSNSSSASSSSSSSTSSSSSSSSFSSSGHHQLRKRVGSKLTMTKRAKTK